MARNAFVDRLRDLTDSVPRISGRQVTRYGSIALALGLLVNECSQEVSDGSTLPYDRLLRRTSGELLVMAGLTTSCSEMGSDPARVGVDVDLVVMDRQGEQPRGQRLRTLVFVPGDDTCRGAIRDVYSGQVARRIEGIAQENGPAGSTDHGSLDAGKLFVGDFGLFSDQIQTRPSPKDFLVG